MIQLITGQKGSGKTKKMVDQANRLVNDQKGSVIFLDHDEHLTYDLKHEVRFIDFNQYPIENVDHLLGFLCGMLAQDHDVETIFMDGVLKFKDIELKDMPKLVQKLEDLFKKYPVNFIMSISCLENHLPKELRVYA